MWYGLFRRKVIPLENINERIAYLIKDLNLTKTKFAERIHVGQPFVSMLCKGDAAPSDRTISDICREFNVSEEWLREGIGEMYVRRTKNQQIAIWLNDVMGADDGDFRKELVANLAELTTEEWMVLERMLKRKTEGR